MKRYLFRFPYLQMYWMKVCWKFLISDFSRKFSFFSRFQSTQGFMCVPIFCMETFSQKNNNFFSSLSLSPLFDNITQLMFILKVVNLVFAVLFFIEMILKWIAFGLWRYFTSAWTCLDFIIVCVSLFSYAWRIQDIENTADKDTQYSNFFIPCGKIHQGLSRIINVN